MHSSAAARCLVTYSGTRSPIRLQTHTSFFNALAFDPEFSACVQRPRQFANAYED
jgi:hypothetical protein